MIKQLYFLSAVALFNLALVAIIANSQGRNQVVLATPTPQIIITKVTKKVQRGLNNIIPTAPQQVTTQNTNSCIVTIDGAKYDVTNFKNMHSGGDIFSCGSDMSSLFWGQHGQRQLKQMQKYRI